jgi:hypothetical protein
MLETLKRLKRGVRGENMVANPSHARKTLEIVDDRSGLNYKVEHYQVNKTLHACVYVTNKHNARVNLFSGTFSKFSQVQLHSNAVLWIHALDAVGICFRPKDGGLEWVSVRDARKLATVLVALRKRGTDALMRLDKNIVANIAKMILEWK